MAIDYTVDGKTAVITINRPEALNAVDTQTFEQLHKAMVQFRDDDQVWVGIITGAGDRAFSAGADIADMLPHLRKIRGRPWRLPDTPLHHLRVYKPLIAAVNGLALGGGLEIMLICDVRIASDRARFGSPEVNLGLIPGWGATQRLARQIPWAKAAEILLRGDPISAQEAYRIGLVNEVVPPAEVMPRARTWAGDLCAKGPLAVRAAKEAMLRGYSMPLDEGIRLETALFDYLLGTRDHEEGRTAFLEKRKPHFQAE